MSASGGDGGGSSDPASVAQGLENTMSSTSANVADSKATNEPNNAGASSYGTTSSSESVIDKSEKPSTSRGESISGENVQSSNSNSNAETPKRLSFREVIANIFEPDQDTSNAAESEMEVEISYEKIATSNELLKEAPVPSKTRKVNIFVENTGPKWYDVQGSNVTQTIDPTKLPEAFEFLPITGRPDYKEELPEFQMNKIREFVGSGLNDTEFLKLAKYCSPDHLKTGKEMITSNRMPKQGLVPYMVDFEPFINPEPSTSKAGNDLCVVKKFKMRLDRDITNTYAKKLKYRGLRMMPLTSEDQDDIPGPPETQLEPGRDVLFRVRIYRPFPYNIRDKPSRIRHSVFSRDLVLLGRQYLSELRDRIVCANDLDMRLDVSERLDHPRARTARELFPSGFFFINNVFYVDTRPGCVDLTERVRQWARHKRGLGEFSRRDMCLTTLDQLRLRLGHPEVYVHQGNCEHLFTFSEIRLLAPREPLSLRHYPRHTAMSQNQTVYCTTCAEFGAKWIVTGCSRVPFDPAFFCDTCLKLYLYIDDRKIGDFKVYSYRGNEINMLKPQG